MEKVPESLDQPSNQFDKKIQMSTSNFKKIIILHEPPVDVTPRIKNQSSSSSSSDTLDNKNTRVIELSDKKTKIDLRREFIIDNNNGDNCETNSIKKLTNNNIKNAISSTYNDNNNNNNNNSLSSASAGELKYCKKIMDDKGNEIFIVPKLPPGTVLIKQTNDDDNNNNVNVNEPANDLLDKLDLRRVEKSAFGIAKQFISPPKKRGQQVRRNPTRVSRKKFDEKGEEDDDSDDNNFSRQKLTSLKRGSGGGGGDDDNNDDDDNDDDYKFDKKQMKYSDVPYMNTRSITKKLYNVGATHETPNVHDGIEWKEWPSHGMHERPVYHPQVGNVADCVGRCFTSMDYTYQDLSQNSLPHQIPTHPSHDNCHRNHHHNNKNKISIEETFEKCMHYNLHAVLAFASQIMTSQPNKIEEKIYKAAGIYKKKNNNIVINQQLNDDNNNNNTPSVQIKNDQQQINENINTMDNNKLLKTTKPIVNSMINIKNHEKLQQVLERGTKNTLILLKTSEQSVKKDDDLKQVDAANSDSTIKLSFDKSIEAEKDCKKNINTIESNDDDDDVVVDDDNDNDDDVVVDDDDNNGNDDKLNWLRELIGNTAILYSAAVGIGQDNLINYLDSLDTEECLDWLKL